jgi:hypothetical protein
MVPLHQYQGMPPGKNKGVGVHLIGRHDVPEIEPSTNGRQNGRPESSCGFLDRRFP